MLWNSLKRRQGHIGTALAFLVLSGFFILSFLGYQSSRLRNAERRRLASENSVQFNSGIEMMLLAYRLAETKYIRDVSQAGCGEANPFLQALKKGSQCPGLASSTVFTTNDNIWQDALFDYPSAGCEITPSSSSCSQGMAKILDIGVTDPSKQVQSASYHFSILAIRPEKAVIDFSVTLHKPKENLPTSQTFAIRPVLANAAHLENDGRLVQERPDPLARCPGSPWGTYFVFDENTLNCMKFATVGSGTGLAYFEGRYFGFRPMDGQVIDLKEASNASNFSYLVDPATGSTASGNVFVPYDKEALINVDDITLIEDQIYFVTQSASSAYIGVLDGTARVNVCSLGAMGWSQGFAGIAAMNWSDPLLPSPTETITPTHRLATFFLKTDTGDMLTAVVQGTATGAPYTCYVMKDRNRQEIEYRRTNGFDRTADSKPFYVY